MANYPISITLGTNTGIIIEITDDVPVNTITNTGFGQGFVRQIGGAVENCAVDDNVYYNVLETVTFKQSTATFVYADSRNVLFIQGSIPT